MKYFSRKCKDADGNVFDSVKERERWHQLKYMAMRGEISNLERQVRFEILPRIDRTEVVAMKTKTKEVVRCEEKAKYYTADFVYDSGRHHIIEDVKSKASAMIRDYPLRRHLMKLLCRSNTTEHGIEWIFVETI